MGKGGRTCAEELDLHRALPVLLLQHIPWQPAREDAAARVAHLQHTLNAEERASVNLCPCDGLRTLYHVHGTHAATKSRCTCLVLINACRGPQYLCPYQRGLVAPARHEGGEGVIGLHYHAIRSAQHTRRRRQALHQSRAQRLQNRNRSSMAGQYLGRSLRAKGLHRCLAETGATDLCVL